MCKLEQICRTKCIAHGCTSDAMIEQLNYKLTWKLCAYKSNTKFTSLSTLRSYKMFQLPSRKGHPYFSLRHLATLLRPLGSLIFDLHGTSEICTHGPVRHLEMMLIAYNAYTFRQWGIFLVWAQCCHWTWSRYSVERSCACPRVADSETKLAIAEPKRITKRNNSQMQRLDMQWANVHSNVMRLRESDKLQCCPSQLHSYGCPFEDQKNSSSLMPTSLVYLF